MLACKQPNIGSGATAIGSTARAPDEGQISDANLQQPFKINNSSTLTPCHQCGCIRCTHAWIALDRDKIQKLRAKTQR